MNIFCIQREMKKYIYLLSCSFWLLAPTSEANAYWENSENINIEKEVITLQIDSEKVTVEHLLTLGSAEPIQTKGFFAFPENTENLKIYWNLDSLTTERLEGKKRIERVFEEAEKKKNTAFFQLANKSFPILVITEEKEIKETTTLKITYETKLQNEQNWKLFSLNPLFENNAPSTDLFVRFPQNRFFLNNLPDPLRHQFNNTDGQKNMHLEYQNQAFKKPLVFAWSDSEKDLKKNYKGLTYHAFPKESEKLNPENITLLIDQSGSMDTGKWQKTSDVIRKLLNDTWTDKNIRVGFFNDELSWNTLDEEQKVIFKKNEFEWRQQLINKVSLTRPLGKTDLKKVLEIAQKEETPENHVWILITDEPSPQENIPRPLAVLGFTDQTQPLKTWESSADWTQSFFGNQAAFFGETQLSENISYWYKPFDTENINLAENITDIQVGSLNPKKSSAFLIGRSQASNFNHPLLQFIPSLWAEKKNQELSRQEQTADIVAAQNSIRTVFGLDAENRATQKTIANIPVYGNQTYDYPERVDPETEISIAPFSEAQKEIFFTAPEKTAEGFAHGTESAFCTDIRCIRVTANGQSESSSFLKAYWQEKDPQHWALEYVKPMVKKGIYPLNPNGDLELEQPIKRGEFAQMLYDQMETHRWRKGKPLVFNDLPEEHPAFKAISWFSEHKIIQGYEDGSVQPEKTISRAEAVKILLAADLFKPNPESSKSFFADTEGWVTPWTNEAAIRNIISGYPNGETVLFKPHQPLTKGQAAKIITKFGE